MEHINTFNEGLDFDTSKNKRSNATYYDALDLRIISDEALSNGALVNFKGTKSKIDLFDRDHKLIGYCQIRNTLVLFLTGEFTVFGDSQMSINFFNVGFDNGKTFTIEDNSGVHVFLFSTQFNSSNTPPSGYDGYIGYNGATPSDSAQTNQMFVDEISLNPWFSSNYTVYINEYGVGISKNSGKFRLDSNASGLDIPISSIIRNLKVSKIYKIELDNSNSIQSPILVYSDERSVSKLNFPEDGKISAKGRYESNALQKIYWIDGVNQLRSININDYSVVNGVTVNNNLVREASSFDSVPPNDMSGSISTEIINGAGSYNSGVVFYAYQFYKKNGASSTIYKSQYPVKLSLYSGSSDGGGDVGEGSKCAVKVSITGISAKSMELYDRIRIYAVLYEEQLAPSINIVSERSISSNISVIDNGDPIGTMSNEEFSFYKESSYVPNVIESKDNILFIGNINENIFLSEELDLWDSRAYRFSSDNFARMSDSTGVDFMEINSNFKVGSNTIGLPETFTIDVPNDFDCYNKYNDTYSSSLQSRNLLWGSKFKSDGVTIGGSGKNISYSFTKLEKYIDSSTLANNYNVREGKDFVISNQTDIWTNTTNSSSVTAIECESGEVYRVGIKFFNNKGQSSFVKWIGDVLWEEVSEAHGYPLSQAITIGIRTNYAVLNITVDHTNLPSDVSAYQIVRAKRTSLDKTSLANGLLRQTQTDGDIERADVYLGIEAATYVRNGTIDKYVDTKSLFRFISPDIMFNDGTSNKLETYKFRVYNYSGGTVSDHEYDKWGGGNKQSALAYKSLGIKSLSTESTTDAYSNIVGISAYKAVSPLYAEGTVSNPNTAIDGYQYRNQQRNFYNSDDYGSGCSCYVVSLDDTLHVEGNDATGADNIFKFFYASLISNNEKSRYGGISYSDIQDTQYVPFSNIQKVSGTSSSVLCVHGDSYTNMFYYMESLFFDDKLSPEGAYALSAFPVQSSIDLRRRLDRLLEYVPSLDSILSSTSNIDTMHPQETVENGVRIFGATYDQTIGDLYRYNPVYSSENNTSTSISKPVDFVEYGFNDVKILASDKKVNTEDIDSWTNFGTNEFIEVASEYGSLNELMFHKNFMYFFQDNAVGLLAINDRSLISGDSNIKLALGTGGVLERFDYINTNVGAVSKHHLIKTKEDIFIVDVLNKGIFPVSNLSGSLSLEAGVSSFVKSKINELGKGSAVAIGYDKEFNEIIFTINGESIVYSDSTKKFTSKYSTAPKFFISLNDRLMSYVDDETSTGTARYVYQHNLGEYGEYYSEAYQDSGLNLSTLKLSILVNPNNILINRFDVIDFRTDIIEGSDKIAIDRLTFENSYITPIVKNIVTSGQYKNTSFLITGFRTQIPLTTNGNRFVDSYMIVSFEFDNRNNIPFRLHDVMTFYENSKR